jgi:DNA-binding LacI/PurR family transcriptional regulator
MQRLKQNNGISSEQSPLTQNVIDPLSTMIFDRSSSLQRQITDGVRDLIRRGDLQPGTRVPSIQELANLWSTNHFTVQKGLKPLVEEGLLERQPRIGTRVRTPPDAKCFGLYLGHRILSDQGRMFYMTLYAHLHTLLAEAGYELRIWIDSRDVSAHVTPPADLLAAIERRELRGLIAPAIRDLEVTWLKKLPIPVVGIVEQADPQLQGTVKFDEPGMFRAFMEMLAKEGCEQVGFICPISELVETFKSVAHGLGFKTRQEWIPAFKHSSNRAFGEQALRRIWTLSEKPKAIIVFPDTAAQGVVEAVWKLGIKVPAELRLCLHRNEGIDIVCPFPVHWAETSLSGMSKLFFEALQAKIEGKPLDLPYYLPFKMIR